LKIKIAIYFCLLFSFISEAQNPPKISLLTFETGNESHTVFGHTAIRVQDTSKQTDLVYGFDNLLKNYKLFIVQRIVTIATVF